MQRQLKLRAGTLEKLEALLDTNPADDDDENGDLDSIAHIDKDLIPKISRLRGDREELIRMCSDAVQELNRKEEQNRALEEANQAQGKLIGELQQQMQELREQMERLAASQQPKQPSREEARRRTTGTRGGEQVGERRGGGARRGPDSKSSSSGRRHRARGRGIDGSEGTEFSSEGEDDADVYTNGRHQRGEVRGAGGGHRRQRRGGGGRRLTYSDEEDSDGSYSDYETGSSDDGDSYDDDDNDSSGRRLDRRKHARTSKGRSAAGRKGTKQGHRHAIGSDTDEAVCYALPTRPSTHARLCEQLIVEVWWQVV
jgi:hypothetical protein